MPHQLVITICAQIMDGRSDAVARTLAQMHQQGAAHNDRIPFGELTGVHFARLFVLDELPDLEGKTIPATLYYLADVDAPMHRHLLQLAELSGTESVFGHCIGFPDSGDAGDTKARVGWLRQHSIPAAATYTHTVGRSVRQVRDEERLRKAIEEFLDNPDGRIASADSPMQSSVSAYQQTRDFVLGDPDLRWARRAPHPPGLIFRLRRAIQSRRGALCHVHAASGAGAAGLGVARADPAPGTT